MSFVSSSAARSMFPSSRCSAGGMFAGSFARTTPIAALMAAWCSQIVRDTRKEFVALPLQFDAGGLQPLPLEGVTH